MNDDNEPSTDEGGRWFLLLMLCVLLMSIVGTMLVVGFLQ